MIATIFNLSWLNLRRDRVALVLTFVLPLIFFSIFASVFGAMDQEGGRRIVTVLVVEDDHPASSELAGLLRGEEILEILEPEGGAGRDQALGLVRSGQATLAVVIPPGFGESLAEGLAPVPIELLSDRSNPMALGLVSGLLRSRVLELGFQALADAGAFDEVVPPTAAGAAARGPLELRVVDVLGGEKKRPSVAFFAAGIGVMFLLFAVSGRSAILIEERESGVLQRMLAARVTMNQLLLGRWLFLLVLGASQVAVMFAFAALAFGLDLWTWRHLAGFAVITLAAAAAAAAFGLVLSSACRSRAQLNGVAAVTILILSALGGSMFPSFLMPDRLQAIGRLTFNSWALTGYQKVFWYEATVPELWPQVAVLGGFCLTFLAASRWLARRWQVI